MKWWEWHTQLIMFYWGSLPLHQLQLHVIYGTITNLYTELSWKDSFGGRNPILHGMFAELCSSLGEYVWYLHVPRDCFTVVWDLLLYHVVTFLFAADIHVALDGTESDRLICGLGSCSENEANCLKYFLIDMSSFTHVVYYMYMYIILAIRKIYLLAQFLKI